MQDVKPDQVQDCQRCHDRLRLLREIDRAILRAQSVDQTAAAAVQGFRRLVLCLRASVAIFDFAADEVLLLATSSDCELQLCAGARAQLSRAFFLGDSSLGQPHLVTDLGAMTLVHPWVEWLRSEGVRAYASLPLVTEGQVIGALTFGLAHPGPPTPEALEIAADIADQLAVALLEARLRDEIRRHSEELETRVTARTEVLRVTEARFRAVFEVAPIGMLIAAPDGRILQSNPALQRLLGRSGAELEGAYLKDFVRARDGRHQAIRHLADAAAQGSPYETELALLPQDGRSIWAHLTLARVPSASGAGDLAVIMIQDITEARKTQVALVQAEKLAITGRLGASLAHEINNPLQSIIGCLGLAEETLSDTVEASRYLAVAREELRRVTRTIAQLRDLQSFSESERVEPLDLNETLAQLLTLNTPRCTEQGIQVVWQPARRLPPLMLVPDRIRQVFLNLLLNAMDAMPEGGVLAVRTMQSRKPFGMRVTVRDTGPGIPAAILERVFEPFYTTKKKGLGLGLFTSRSIIERHRGTIEVHSRPGQGTTFVVWLPALPEGSDG